VNRLHLPRVDQVVLTALAAAASFFTLVSWKGLADDSSAYLVPLFFTCVLTGALGLALRTLGAALVVVPVTQAIVAFLLLNHLWAAEESLGGFLPTSGSVSELVSVISEGGRQAALWPAPVPTAGDSFPALMLAIGMVVVLLVDLLACTLRRVPVAGLPLLAAFTVPVSIVGGVSWVTFAVAALCFTLLLTADQAARLGRWGHTLAPTSRQDSSVVDNQPHQVRLGTLWPSATRYAVAGVALAVVTPALLPSGLDLFGGNGNGDGAQDGDSVTLRNPMVSVQRRLNQGEDVPLVTVKTDDPHPSYLRLTVLDDFDGTAWRPSQRDIPPSQKASGQMPAAPGLSTSTPRDTYTSEIKVDKAFESTWLPVPYPATQVRVSGDWRYDLDTLDLLNVDKKTTAGLEYAAVGQVVHPDPAAMVGAPVAPRSIYAANTALPSTVPPWIVNLAKSVTSQGRSQWEKAVILQRWFRVDGGFTYSTTTGSGSGLDQLEQFLGFDEGSREGYCEQFASAMAMMARALGIPARVSVGFLEPQRQPDGSFVYSSHDMHAWPELYFQGAGWTIFEPTPADQARTTPSYTQGRVPRPGAEPSADPSASDFNEEIKPSADVKAGQSAELPGTAESRTPWYVGAGVLVLVVLLLVPRLLRRQVRRRRLGAGRDPAHRLPVDVVEGAWAEVRATALDLGLGWDDGATLRRRARALAASLDGDRRAQPARAALERLVLLMERSRYSRDGLPADEAAAVLAATEEVLASLRARALPAARRRATWVPSSLWQSRKVHGSARRGTGAGAGSKVPTDELDRLSV
jgi:transglutaminase-like putative cysteine protease